MLPKNIDYLFWILGNGGRGYAQTAVWSISKLSFKKSISCAPVLLLSCPFPTMLGILEAAHRSSQ